MKELKKYLDGRFYLYMLDEGVVTIPFKYEQSAGDHADRIKDWCPNLAVKVEQSPDKMGYNIIVNRPHGTSKQI